MEGRWPINARKMSTCTHIIMLPSVFILNTKQIHHKSFNFSQGIQKGVTAKDLRISSPSFTDIFCVNRKSLLWINMWNIYFHLREDCVTWQQHAKLQFTSDISHKKNPFITELSRLKCLLEGQDAIHDLMLEHMHRTFYFNRSLPGHCAGVKG